MLNVLVNAYAVSPAWGSEPGMGWNWVVNIARYCNVFVITEGEWRAEIEEAVEKLPQQGNLHFYFNPVSERVRRMCWNQGDWRFYWHYRKWQKRTLDIARQIIADHHIDIIHQLNMIGFREPGYLWKIQGIPFVWGPVGGMEMMPLPYLKGSGLKQNIFGRLKNTINEWQYKYSPNVRCAIKRSNAIIAAVKGVQEVITTYYHKDSTLINETGVTLLPDIIRNKKTTDEFHIIWIGKFDFRKRLDIALKTIAITKNPHIHFHICGTGNPRQEGYYKYLASKYQISQQCHWHGKVEHNKIFEFMANCDLFFFTSIMEATSTVVLEAISVGLPILCFNICGFGPLVNSFAGVAIELSTPDTSAYEFSQIINHFVLHHKELEAISTAEIKNRERLSWDYKARQMVEIYHKAKI